jgi:hypothetical protein
LGLFHDALSTAHTGLCCVGLMGWKIKMGRKKEFNYGDYMQEHQIKLGLVVMIAEVVV